MSKVAFVTGGASGFGLELSKKLIGLGWIVYAADKDSKAVQAAKSFGAVPVTLDVTDHKKTKSAIDSLVKKEGRIDLLVANAGFGNFSSVEEMTSEQVQQIFAVNVFGVEACIRAALPHMRSQRSGRILITTSVVAHVSLAGLGWYAATKHSMKAVANALRQEVRDLGICVSTIEPGTSKTGFGSVAFGLLKEGRSVSEYDTVMKGVNKWLGGMYRISPGPQKVVNKMLRAATAPRPRAHYAASWDVRALKLVFYLMPRRWLDGFILWLAKK
jgi:NAD(P)-dependent dehydrogenase (short-subunit alcohol dehydrogenase family)